MPSPPALERTLGPPEALDVPAGPGADRPSGRPPRSEQDRADRARMRTLAAPLLGLGVGVVLSLSETHLAGELHPLVQSTAVFLLVPFVLGALMRTARGAAAAGLVCGLAQLGAWAGAATLWGGALHPSLALSLLVCAVVGGPLLGGAGHLARRGAPWVRGLGLAAAVAVLVADGAWQDLVRLHARTVGWGSIAVGVALAALTLRRVRRARWLALTLPLAVLGEIGLTLIHR